MHWNSFCGRNRAVWSTSTQGGVKNEDQVASHRLAPWRCSKIVKYHPFARPWTNTLASGLSSIGFTDHHWIHTAVYQIIFSAQTFGGWLMVSWQSCCQWDLGAICQGLSAKYAKGGCAPCNFAKRYLLYFHVPMWLSHHELLRFETILPSFTTISFNVLWVKRRTNIETYVYS